VTDAVASVTDADFESQVLQAGEVVLVDFWAEWCAPCRMIAPVVRDLAGELGGRVKVLRLDVDHNPGVPGRLGIMSMPTLVIFKDGQPVDRVVGYRSNMKRDLRQRLEALL
jgi:thioredoxin 1